MKQLLSILLTLTLSNTVAAQSTDDNDVVAAVEKLRKAMVDADKATLETIAAPDLSYGHSSGKIENKESFVNTLTAGKSDFVSITLSDQTVHVADNTALVRHTLKGETNDGGKPGAVNLGVLLVWQKRQGQWKLIARQAFKL